MDLDPNPAPHGGFTFETFALFPAERRLLHGGVALRVGSRSLDILTALVARAGEIITKDELIAIVWPDTIVEDSALRVHISTLRKTLGDGENGLRLIANVPGRGYSFVAPVKGPVERAVSLAPSVGERARPRLPGMLTKIIGRDEVLDEISAAMSQRRLVSIVGPGGMGKTTVALAVARRLLSGLEQNIAFVDFAQLGDAALVPGAVATALGLPVRSGDVIEDIVTAIDGRHQLLLFDSCEHLVDVVAQMAEELLAAAPLLRILATSREALRAQGEWVHRLRPLDLPPETPGLCAAQALAFPAVQLFVERASSVLGGYELADAQAPLVAGICRRLDGIALAIELATGRLDGMSVAALARSLETGFETLTRGRRTALARHQTLRGAIDWSYGILSLAERTIFQRLSVFVGPFAAQDARVVVSCDELAADQVEDVLLTLVAKSLVVADTKGGEARYRLLDTMRAYAAEQLQQSAYAQTLRRRHAGHIRDLLGSSRNPADLAGQIGNLRAAIDWAFGEQGDGAIGVALTVNAIPLWFHLSLVDECIGQVQSALAWLEASPEPDPKARMQLYAGLGFPQMRAIARFPSGVAAWRSALEIAEDISDADYQARALWALWTDRVNCGEAREAMSFASRFAELADTNPDAADPLIARRIKAWSLLMLGDLHGAHHDIAAMLARYDPARRGEDVARFQYDQRGVARITLARTLWLTGHADQALSEVEDTLADMAATGHTLTLAHVLSDAACFVALWRGDLDLAERTVAALRLHTGLQALDVWHLYGDCFEGEIRIRRGDVSAGVRQLSAGIETLRAAGFLCYHTAFSGVLAEGLRLKGDGDAALATVEEALAICVRTGGEWCTPELMRIHADILTDLGRAEEAAPVYQRSLAQAASQGALAWELRTATAWARATLGDAATARLRSVLDRFGEGFATADVVAARAFLATLG